MDVAERFAQLFAGREDARGSHGSMGRSAPGEKREIKSTARTLRGGPTLQHWRDHLTGTAALGVIPIRADSTCLWGAIDVDQYDLDLAEVVKRVAGLPLVVCRSKSGGAHVFVFLSETTPAGELRDRLREVAASLGWGDCEIFPKQSHVDAERGDFGNWLNMPYLGGDATERYGVKPGGAAMTASEFLAAAEAARTGLQALVVKRRRERGKQDESLSDGPPCLEHLSAIGFPQGSRNNGLFGLAVFCKKKYGEGWREVLLKYNENYMVPPLPIEEVDAMLARMDEKGYGYQCDQSPCAQHCERQLCRTRRYGVRGTSEYPTIQSLQCMESEPSLWFVDVGENRRLELSTMQLRSYEMFAHEAAEQIKVHYGPMKRETWSELLSEIWPSIEFIEAPPELSAKHELLEALDDWLTDRQDAEGDSSQLLDGKPWYDAETERYWFRLSDLMAHLLRVKLDTTRVWTRVRVSQRIKEWGGDRGFKVLRGKHGRSLFWIPRTALPSGGGRREVGEPPARSPAGPV